MDNIDKNLQEKLQKIANNSDTTIISFVAPQEAIRISPAQIAYATITEKEMYELEQKVKKAKENPKATEKLHFVIHTPGGELYTSYKIAYFLRLKFKEIHAFVPYQAASGGTLLCCAANKIYLGDLGNLTPIDPQIKYKDVRVSAYAYERAVDFMQKKFGEVSPQEVFTPYQQMASKFDPIIFDEMYTLVRNTWLYADTLLEKSGYTEQNALHIAFSLTKTIYSHSHVLLKEDAATLGFNIGTDDESMSVYNELVEKRLKEKSATHCIDAFYPEIVEARPALKLAN